MYKNKPVLIYLGFVKETACAFWLACGWAVPRWGWPEAARRP